MRLKSAVFCPCGTRAQTYETKTRKKGYIVRHKRCRKCRRRFVTIERRVETDVKSVPLDPVMARTRTPFERNAPPQQEGNP